MRHRRQGRIVNVASILGRFALPGSGIYAASKFALEAASDALWIELAPFGVQVVMVVVVEPGVIATPLYQRAAAALPDDPALEPYRAVWPGGFGFPERLLQAAASVDTIAATLAEAALAPRPRPRYRPGLRNRLNTWLLTTLPTGSDRVNTQIAGATSALPAAPGPDSAAPTPPRRSTHRGGRRRQGGRRVNRAGDRTAIPSTLVRHRGAAAGRAVPGGQPTITGPVADQAALTARPPRSATRAAGCSGPPGGQVPDPRSLLMTLPRRPWRGHHDHQLRHVIDRAA